MESFIQNYSKKMTFHGSLSEREREHKTALMVILLNVLFSLYLKYFVCW